jgi:hypothetical protein
MTEAAMEQQEKTELTQIDAKYQRFVAAMIDAPTLTSACRKCKISDDTGRRWLAIPEVKQVLDELSSRVFDQDVGRLKRVAGFALDTLVSALTDADPNPTKVRAAHILLEKSLEFGKIQELEKRMVELENHLKGNK